MKALVGLFGRNRDRAAAAASFNDGGNEDEAFVHQGAVLALLDDFHHLDLEALAAMTAAQRSEQVRVRRAMYAYADAMWDDLKRRGLEPVDHPEEYNSVAALRDLTSELVSHQEQAQEAAGDIEDD